MRKIFGPKSEEVTREWRGDMLKRFNDLCFSPDIIRAIKLRGMRVEGHVVCVGVKRNAYRGSVVKF